MYILSASLGRNPQVKQLDLIHTLVDTSSFDELEKSFVCSQSRREAKLFCRLNVKFMKTRDSDGILVICDKMYYTRITFVND